METQNYYTNSIASALKQLQSRVVRFCINHIWSFIWAAVFILWAHLVCDYSKLSSFDKIQFVLINFIGGPFASVYFIHAVVIFFCRPIKRDWILSKGRYLTRVILFVLSVPIMLTFWVSTINNTIKCCEFIKCEGIDYAQIMYVGEMYGDGINNEDECPSRTSSNADSSLCDRCGAEEHSPSLLWMIFYHFVDPGNQHTTLSYCGRVIAGVSAGLGVLLLNGLLVSVIVGWFDSKREKWTNGDARYVKYLGKRNPYVIIGGGDIDVHIVKSIFQREKSAALKAGVQVKYPYIIIQTMSNVEELRNNIYSMLDDESQQRHVVIYRGDRTSKSDVDDLNIATAREIYILGETNNQEAAESMHDTYNMKCLEHIVAIRPVKDNEKYRPNVYMMFEHQTTFSIYQFTNLKGIDDKINFKPMNFYELWALKVLANPNIKSSSGRQYFPIEGEVGISANSEEFVHLVICGMSRMGVALGIEAAHLAHYPNFVTNKKRTRITFISPNMEQERNYFVGRFKSLFKLARQRYVKAVASEDGVSIPHIYDDESYGKWINPMYNNGENLYKHLGEDFIDVEWEFIDGSVENPVVQQYIADALDEKHKAKLSIAMCQPESSAAVASAIYLPREVYASTRLLQVLVYQRCSDSLFSTLDKGAPFYGKIKAFGMISDCFNIDYLTLCSNIGDKISKAYDIAQEKPKVDEQMLVFFGESNCAKILSDAKSLIGNNIEEVIDIDQTEKLLEQQYKKDEKLLEQQCQKDVNMSGGKSKAAKLWSNFYGANMLWIRLRCWGGQILSKERNASDLLIMSAVEHNRWNMEQLLMTFDPLTFDEQQVFLYSRRLQKQYGCKKSDDCKNCQKEEKSYKCYVDKINKSMMKHHYICSFDRLQMLDGETIHNDLYIILASDYIFNINNNNEEPRNS